MKLLYFFLCFVFSTAQAQLSDTTKTKKNTIFSELFKKSQVKAQWRNFYMLTDNEEHLTDYQTLASGLKIQVATNQWKGFQLGVGFSYVLRVFENNILKSDPTTNAKSRYEIGLYDLANPQKKNDIYLLHELNLKYQFKYGILTFGKQLLKTPFINPQDGRMMPTYAEGFYAESKTIKNWKFQLGIVYKIAPRGVSQWSFVDKSIGIYPVGVQNNGQASKYPNQLSSKGIAILGVEKQLKSFNVKMFDMAVENIMNTAFAQVDYFLFKNAPQQFQLSVQSIRQDGLGNGGNTESDKSYFQKNGKSMTFGGKMAYYRKSFELSINYNRITKAGRFLIPREWGIEPFFTFLPRERSDGFADVHAYAFKCTYLFSKQLLRPSLGLAYVQLPDVKNFAHNKYAMPSYYQLNAEFRYSAKDFLKGFEATVLVVYKKEATAITDPKYAINKVNMWQLNLVTNYNF